MANPNNPNNFDDTLQSFDEIIFAARDFSNEIARSAKQIFQNKIQVIEQVKAFKNLANLSRDFASELSDINDGTKSITTLNKYLINQEKAKNKFAVEYRQVLNQIGIDQSKINRIVEEQQSIYDVLSNDISNLSDAESEILNYYEEQSNILKDQEQTLEQITKRAKTIESAFGGVGKVAESIETALDKIGLSKLTERLGIKDAIDKSRQFAAQLTEGQEKPSTMGKQLVQNFKVLGHLAKGVGTNLVKSLGAVPFIIGAIVKAIQWLVKTMFQADEHATSLARNLTLSKNEAYLLRDYFYDIRGSLESQYKSTEDIIDAQNQLLDLSKFQFLYSTKTLDAQIQMTKELGLSVEEASELNKLFLSNNIEGNDGLKTLYKQLSIFSKERGIRIDSKKILSETSKISGQILTTFRGSTTELFKSVIKAEELGINLAKARDIAKGFLDFESSISSELEAELLTGKNLNLEAARRLSLQGKFVEAAEEASKQIGDYNYFSNLNVIQQEALAKSINMGVDELSEMLRIQKFQNKEIKEQAKRLIDAKIDIRGLDEEEISNRAKMLTAQQKFENSLKRAQDIFTGLVEGGTLDKLADLLTKVVDSLVGVKDYNKTIADKAKEKNISIDSKTQKRIEELQKIIENEPGMIRKGIFTGIANVLSLGTKPNLFGIQDYYKDKENEANVAKSELQSIEKNISEGKKVDDFIMRPGMEPIKFNKDDLIIGGTNLMNKPSNNSEVTSLLKELISLVKNGGNVYLDSTKVGNALTIGTFKTQ